MRSSFDGASDERNQGKANPQIVQEMLKKKMI